MDYILFFAFFTAFILPFTLIISFVCLLGRTDMWKLNIPKMLTLSGRMSIYNWHGDITSTDECRYMIQKVSFVFLPSYVDYMSLMATVSCANVFMNVLSASCRHTEVIIWTPWGMKAIYILRCVSCLLHAFNILVNLGPLDWRNDT
jgi:hypothetical protein